MENGAIKYAKSKYLDVDIVVNVYTQQICWMSAEAAESFGYEKKEMEDASIRDVVTVETEKIVDAIYLLFGKDKSIKQQIKGLNDQSLEVESEIRSFEYQNEPYIAVCGVSVTKL